MEISAILETLQREEDRVVKAYTEYQRTVQDEGIRKLIAHIDDQERDHLHKHRETLGVIDGGGDVPDECLAGLPQAFPGVPLLDFLSTAVKIEKALEERYRCLSRSSGNESMSHLFTLLAEEEKKHSNWFQDRLDLENLRY